MVTFLFVVASTVLVMMVESVADYSTAKILFFGTIGCLLGATLLLRSAVGARYNVSLLTLALCSLPYLAICVMKPGSLNAIASIITVLLILFFFNKFEFSRSFANLCILWIGGVLLFHAVYAVQLLDFRQFQSLYWQKNEFAANVLTSLFLLSYFLHMEYHATGKLNGLAAISIGLCVLLLYISSSRGSLLTAVVFAVLYFGWGYIGKSRWRCWALFGAIILSCAMAIPVYLYLSTLSIAPELNSFSVKWTGQLFFSGRNNQWPVFLYLVYLNPWWGYGFNNDFTQWLASVGGLPKQYAIYSADNFFITIALQTGLIGLLCVLFFLTMVWQYIMSFRERIDFRIVAPMFLAYFIHEIFETSFIQGNLQVCVFIWLLVGVATSDRAPKSFWGLKEIPSPGALA
jgi:O-antigen ligase